MKDRVFFDTNIICYAFDSSEPSKRKVCERLIERVYKEEILGVISNQVLVETYNVLTRKFGISTTTTRDIMKSLTTSKNWYRINYNSNTVNRAIDDLERFQVSFLDLLIAETMKENLINEIITENVKDFEKISGIKAINPFKS